MFKTLETYLDMSASPEQSAMILSACHALYDAGYTAHSSIIEQELAIADNLPDDLVLGLVNGYLLPLYVRTLSEFGITLNPDVKLPMATSILQAVMMLDNWADPESLIDAVSIEQSPEDALCAVLAIVGADTIEAYLEAIDEVSEDLVNRIRDVNERAADTLESVGRSEFITQRAAACVGRVRALSAALRPEQYSLLGGYLADGGKLAMPPNLLNNYVTELSQIKSVGEAAYQILALLCATTIEHIHLVYYTMHLLEQLDLDQLTFTGVDRDIRALVDKLPGDTP